MTPKLIQALMLRVTSPSVPIYLNSSEHHKISFYAFFFFLRARAEPWAGHRLRSVPPLSSTSKSPRQKSEARSNTRGFQLDSLLSEETDPTSREHVLQDVDGRRFLWGPCTTSHSSMVLKKKSQLPPHLCTVSLHGSRRSFCDPLILTPLYRRCRLH